ncbi:hypothetical protein FQA39_LY14249 [Lamprigera yunnana]|nr:hypothetical protein FQA39_LY14249 [Lamprigera yunnana]
MNHREFIEPTLPLVCIVVLFLLIMILHNCNVELTKVHYRDDDRGISIISRSDPLFVPPKNTLIKKNIFGHTWILKINESDDDFKKSKTKIVAYTLIFGSIVTVVFFGIFFSIDTSWFSAKSFGDAPVNTSKVDVQKEVNVSARGLCQCENNEVCLKVIENELPRCEQIVDKKDPTGCGGLCKVNEEYCKRIQSFIYQCRSVTKLNCSGQLFNCGNRCIPMKMRCDGVINCSNKLDEKNCSKIIVTYFSTVV